MNELNPNCPSCHTKGKPVKAVTLQSLVKAEPQGKIDDSPYRFCESKECDVVYYAEDKEQTILKDDMTLRVGVKESEAPRHVCYCFNHTVEEIEDEIQKTGKSTVLNDIKTKMKEACWCETKNPSGSCCLGTVTGAVKNAAEQYGKTLKGVNKLENPSEMANHDCCGPKESLSEKKKNIGLWATTGATIAAVLSSACCWLPLILIAFGASAAGVSGFFEAYRIYFLWASVALLALCFYLIYFKKEPCEPGDVCALPSPKLLCFNKSMLWLATAVIALFAAFPNYSGYLFKPERNMIVETSLNKMVLQIDGMTCAGCSTNLKQAFKKIPGVTIGEVDHKTGQAIVYVTKNQNLENKLINAVQSLGFKLKEEK